MKFLKANVKTLSIIGALLVLLIIASFCDLNISKAVADLEGGAYYSKNGFGVFWEVFGETPVYIVPSISLGVIFFFVYRGKKLDGFKLIAFSALIAIAMLGLNYYGSHKLVKYMITHGWIKAITGIHKTLTICGFDLVFTALWLFVASRVKEEHLKSAAICALIAIIMAVFSQGATQLIKPFFGRARFRMLYVLNDYSQYTDWFVINGKRSVPDFLLNLGVAKDGYKSFPSGHTSAAAIVFGLLAIPKYFPKLGKKWNIAITAFVLLYTATVAFSRMVMGAHYLSDVTVGALLSAVGFLIGDNLVDKLIVNRKKQNN